MSDKDSPVISAQTLKLIRRYAPDMGVSFPLDEESAYMIYKIFIDHEISYASEAEDIKMKNGDWMPIEAISNMFADAADELSDFEENNPDYVSLSKMIEEIEIEPDDIFPEYRQFYDKKGNPIDYRL